MKVVIIGSGIAGLSAAWELGNRGVRDITVLDQYPLATRASWAGGGILSPICPWDYPEPVQRLFLDSYRQYDDFFARIQHESGIDPEYLRCGLRIQPVALEKAGNWCSRHGIRHEISATGKTPGLFLPDFAQVRNPRLLKAMLSLLRERGVRFVSGVRIQPPPQEHRLAYVTDGQQRWHADAFVAATGAWTARWLGDSRLPTPVKGQMVLFASGKSGVRPMRIAERIYLVPRQDGQVLAGSTLEPGTWDSLPKQQAIETLIAEAAALDNTLTPDRVVATWAGLRPYQPDGIPLIGRHERISNLYLHCGHYRNGFNLNPASCQRLVDAMGLEQPD